MARTREAVGKRGRGAVSFSVHLSSQGRAEGLIEDNGFEELLEMVPVLWL